MSDLILTRRDFLKVGGAALITFATQIPSVSSFNPAEAAKHIDAFKSGVKGSWWNITFEVGGLYQFFAVGGMQNEKKIFTQRIKEGETMDFIEFLKSHGFRSIPSQMYVERIS